MKKLYIAFVILSVFLFTTNIFAQAASITWQLDNTTQLTSVNVGNVTGSAESISSGSGQFGMSVFDYNADGQRLWEGTAGWIAGTEEASRYIQFNAAPASGNSFTVTNVSFNYGAAGADNNVQSNAYYSTDGWVTRNPLNTNPLAYPGSGMSSFTQNVSVTLASGTTFSVRIYPYAVVNSSPMRPTFAVHNNVVITGTISAKKNCVIQVTDVAGKWGKSVVLTAKLFETGLLHNTNIPNQELVFLMVPRTKMFFDTLQIIIGSGTTDANGIASIAYTIPQDSAASSLVTPQDSAAHTITASFAGDANYNPQSSTGKLTVVRHVTSVNVPATTTVFGQPVVFSATLIDNDSGGKGVSNQELKFYYVPQDSLNQKYIGSGTTNSSGVANVAVIGGVAVAASVGGIIASFAGDVNYSAKSGTGTLKKMTSIQTTNAAGKWGKSVLLTARLQETGLVSNTNLPNQVLKFYQDSVYINSATTDKSGVASLMYTIPQDSVKGSITAPQDSVMHSITVSFAGDANYGTQSGTGKLIVVRHITSLAVTPVTGVSGQPVVFTATLMDNDNNGSGIPKQVIKFSIVEGTGSNSRVISLGSGSTNSNGVASISYTMPGTQDSVSRSIAMDCAGDFYYSPVSGTAKLGFAVKSCVVQITNAAGKWGNSILLTARMQEIGLAGNTNLPNQVLRFYVNNKYVNSGTTNSSGVANLMYIIPQDSVSSSSSIITPQDSVTRTISATFVGDANYSTQSSSGKLTVAKHVTSVSVAPKFGSLGQTITLQATLTDNDNSGKGISNQVLKFTIVEGNGAQSIAVVIGSVETAGGVAGISYTIPQDSAAATHVISAVYSGSGNYSAQIGTGLLTYTLTGVEKNQMDIPTKFDLLQNYPNPFNPTSTIRYDIPKMSPVRISVYDILGKEIKVLVNEEKSPGQYEVIFDAKNLASGIYFYTIRTGDFAQTKKMILLK